MTSASAFYFDSSNLESNPLFGPVAPNPTAPLSVAYQGEPGAYSEQAIRQLFGRSSYPNLRPYACASFSSVFAALQKREAEYALLPIENSLGGSIHDNYDLLLRHRVTIVAELQFRVSHCLVSRKRRVRARGMRVTTTPERSIANLISLTPINHSSICHDFSFPARSPWCFDR